VPPPRIWAPAASATGCDNEFTNGNANGGWIDAGNREHGVPSETEAVCIPAGIPEAHIPLAAPAPAKAKSVVARSPLTITATATLTIKESSNAFSNELTSVDLEGTLHTEGSSLKLHGANIVQSGGQITAAGTPTVTLLSGGTLGGSGTIGPSFIAPSGSTVQPGGSEAVGTPTFSSAYDQSEGAHLDLDLASAGTRRPRAGGEQGGGSSAPGGSVRCVVPKVAGLPLAKSKKALRTAHCAPGKVQRRPSAQVKKGRVTHASKKPRATLPAGSKVNLTVPGSAKVA
jgi:PASTA domain